MPAAWISAGSALIGGISSLSNSGGGSSGGGQVAQGVANIAGGALSANEAQQFANQLGQTANPFGQYNQGFASQLAANAGAPGQGGILGANYQWQAPVQNFANQTAGSGLTNQLSGVGGQLANLLADPSSIYQTPQYQAAFGQGQNAVNSTLAAQGLNASGNQLAALQSYGQTFGQNAYNTQLSQLSGLYGQALGANQQSYNQLAGAAQMGLGQSQQTFNQLSQLSGLASGSPTAAAAAQAQVFGNVNSAYNTVGQGVGQLVNGAGSLLNGLGGSSGGFTGDFSSGLGTSTGGFGDVSGSGGLFGTSAGTNNTGGFNYGGSNSWGFTE